MAGPFSQTQSAANGCQECQICAAMWADVDAERDKVLNSSTDVEKRNKQISAAYAKLYQQNPNNTWVGLASIVSRQAGCAMEHADQVAAEGKAGLDNDQAILQSGMAGDAEGGVGINMIIHSTQLDSATAAKEALAAANKEIFASVYPIVLAVQKYGATAVQACPSRPGETEPIPGDVLAVLPKLESKDPIENAKAADQLARYEQRDVVQAKVYSVPKYRDVFQRNERALKYLGPIARSFGAMPPEVSLSSRCGGQTQKFQGSIMSSDDRIAYYRKLMAASSEKGLDWQSQTMQDIINQARP